ncbi:MAG: hypothetical protein ACI9IP_003544 [Arcticibacterium sp.]|jgi:hypothetical protein
MQHALRGEGCGQRGYLAKMDYYFPQAESPLGTLCDAITR